MKQIFLENVLGEQATRSSEEEFPTAQEHQTSSDISINYGFIEPIDWESVREQVARCEKYTTISAAHRGWRNKL